MHNCLKFIVTGRCWLYCLGGFGVGGYYTDTLYIARGTWSQHTCAHSYTCIPAHAYLHTRVHTHTHTHHQHQHLLLLLLVTDCWLLLKVILEIVVLLWCSFTSLITFLSPQYKTIILSLQPLVSCICPSIITRWISKYECGKLVTCCCRHVRLFICYLSVVCFVYSCKHFIWKEKMPIGCVCL